MYGSNTLRSPVFILGIQLYGIVVIEMQRPGDLEVQVSSIRRFKGNNYKSWVFSLKFLLRQQRVWSIVVGVEKAPAAGPSDEVSHLIPGRPVEASD
jgi:hypothetical protein